MDANGREFEEGREEAQKAQKVLNHGLHGEHR